MIIRSSQRNIVLLASLMIFLFTGQAGAKGFFWCLGEDGHSQLNYAQDDTCCKEEKKTEVSHREQKSTSFAPSDDGCGPCVDIATSFDTACNPTREKNILTDEAIQPALGLTCSTLNSFRPTYAAPSYHLAPPWVSQTLLIHRTIVLLH